MPTVETVTPPNTPTPIGPYSHVARVGGFITIGGTAGVDPATGGLFGLYRWEMVPNAGGPAPHFHRTLAESFYVLVGTVKIYDGREWLDASAGDFVHVPIGGIHGFRNDADAPATMLIHFAPGAPREGYFEGLAEFGRSGRPGAEEMADFYARHDNVWI